MCDDERCVLCNSCKVEDVHLSLPTKLLTCKEFRWERQDLLGKIRQMEETQEWMDELWKGGG